jgi:hypothetical protein
VILASFAVERFDLGLFGQKALNRKVRNGRAATNAKTARTASESTDEEKSAEDPFFPGHPV